MGIFSKTCEYGIKASLYIAKEALNSNEKIGVKKVASAINSPEPFTAKIMQTLSRSKVIKSLKGPTGGFYIEASDLDKIMLSDIVKALDGDQIFVGCGLGFKECNDIKPCPLHGKFKSVRDRLSKMMHNTSLLELATGLDSGLTFLKT